MKKSYPCATPTGKRFAPEHDKSAPVVQVADRTASIVTLEGLTYYVHKDATGGTCLCKTLLAMDAGDNEIRRRSAPKPIYGLAAPFPYKSSPPLTLVPLNVDAWVEY